MTARVRRARALRQILIIGRGKLGSAFARALRAAGVRVTTLGARELVSGDVSERRLARTAARADLIIIAARDARIEEIAAALGRLSAALPPVGHCAGALGIEVLAPLQAPGVPVVALHPLVAFSDLRRSPPLVGASLVISGEAEAVRGARRLARRIGMTPIVVSSIDRAAYHAAAALVANGSAALAALAADVLHAAGLPRDRLGTLLGPLLASVGANVIALGPARALSGPVRRGDARTVKLHLAALRGDTATLYRSLVQAQLPLASALGEAPPDQLAAVALAIEEDARRRAP